jgi:nucleotide-binding universal stress UspA family protein
VIKILLPTDGSAASLHAIGFLTTRQQWFQQALDLHLLNIQPSVRGDVRRFVGQQQLRDYHHDEGVKALAPARAALAAARLACHYHVSVGDDAGALICRFAREQRVDLIIMGKQGQNAVGELLLGSVAGSVSRQATVPLLLVAPGQEKS